MIPRRTTAAPGTTATTPRARTTASPLGGGRTSEFTQLGIGIGFGIILAVIGISFPPIYGIQWIIPFTIFQSMLGFIFPAAAWAPKLFSPSFVIQTIMKIFSANILILAIANRGFSFYKVISWEFLIWLLIFGIAATEKWIWGAYFDNKLVPFIKGSVIAQQIAQAVVIVLFFVGLFYILSLRY